MRHQLAKRKLNRTSEHRTALRRNMAQSLFEHGEIKTTLAKAKDLRPFVERLITLARSARKGDLAARQRLTALLGDRAIIPADNLESYEMMSDAARDRVLRSRSGRRYRHGEARGGQQFTAISVVHHLINNIAGEYEGRPGGYTRVIKLGNRGTTDSAPMAMLQLVGEEDSPGTVTRPEKTARRRRTERRYAAAAKWLKKSGKPGAPKEAEPDEAQEEASTGTAEPESTTAPEENASTEPQQSPEASAQEEKKPDEKTE
jgi:large subunit ribosomal protein L17